jgi:hypothetical protein
MTSIMVKKTITKMMKKNFMRTMIQMIKMKEP